MTPSNRFQKGRVEWWPRAGGGQPANSVARPRGLARGQAASAGKRSTEKGGKGGSTRRQWVSSTEAPETSRSLLESFWKGLGCWPARDRSLGFWGGGGPGGARRRGDA
ncbi:hypothetical protein CIRG_00598 [Coccidioides immitis RMSCC 2394]|uniref:Uncharacterized protein n=1 Tax=Coccidioides immitis RMSCC 2394 TaxID=404692 RepID=A0A0J6XW77_COCIT|nr:hypothetical protein CIRG_00598 [Coccidioides immitis RMSCC 2394]